MFITRECDYAIRIVRALSDMQRLSVNEICEKEDITAPFAYKILKKLQKAEIVLGYRGVHGGYTLKKGADELTLLEVYQAVEPNIFIIECLHPDKTCSRNGEEGCCKVHRELKAIQKELMEMLSRRSLQDILESE